LHIWMKIPIGFFLFFNFYKTYRRYRGHDIVSWPTTFVNSDFSRMVTNDFLKFFEFLVVEDSARIAFPLGNKTFDTLGIKFMNPFGNTYAMLTDFGSCNYGGISHGNEIQSHQAHP